MKLIKKYQPIIIFIFIFIFQAISGEDLSNLKGDALAEKLYSKLQVNSYQLNMEFINSDGDVRQITTFFLEPYYLYEEMNVSYSKNPLLKEEHLTVICDGKFLWILLQTASFELFEFIEIKKLMERQIEIKDFFRKYSMGNVYAFSRIYKNTRIIPNSWKITGKKEIDGKECYELTYIARSREDPAKTAESKMYAGCEDAIPRVPGLRILSFMPFIPLTPQKFSIIPPKDLTPIDATETAIRSYFLTQKKKEQSSSILPELKIPEIPEKDKIQKEGSEKNKNQESQKNSNKSKNSSKKR